MTSPQNLPQHRSNAVLPESDNQFDQALANWFARHQGGWSGTTSELIAAVRCNADTCGDLWAQPARALYGYLESHRQTLYLLGVDVLPNAGFPRLVRLRQCPEGALTGKPLDAAAISPSSELPAASPPSVDQKMIQAVPDVLSPVEEEAPSPFVNLIESAKAESIAEEEQTDREDLGSRAFENTAEALFSIVEMRERIKAEGLDLRSTIDLVARRTHVITGSSGVVIGWLQHDTLVYPAKGGIAATMTAQPSQSNLLRACITKGTVLPMPDAQRDPVVGASCRLEKVKSLIVAPIFHNRTVVGAMELLFQDKRCFSSGDVMTLELVADLVSERAAGVGQKETTQPTAQETTSRLRITESIEPGAETAFASPPVSRRRVWILP